MSVSSNHDRITQFWAPHALPITDKGKLAEAFNRDPQSFYLKWLVIKAERVGGYHVCP